MLYHLRLVSVIFLTLNSFDLLSESPEKYRHPVTIAEANLDDLVLKGIRHIKDNGETFKARAGSGQQAYDVLIEFNLDRKDVTWKKFGS